MEVNDYRAAPDQLEARYGVVLAEALREEIRKADNGWVVYFAGSGAMAFTHSAEERTNPVEFKRAA